MGVRRNDKLTVIGVPIPGWESSTLDKSDSIYTLSNPRPGVADPNDPRSKMNPIIMGAQTADIEIRTTLGGNPGAGAAIAVRQDGETDWIGYSDPHAVMAAGVYVSTTTAGYPRQAMADSLNGRYVFVAYTSLGGTGNPIICRRIDTEDSQWAQTSFDIATATGAWTGEDVTLYRLQDGRLVCMYFTSGTGTKFWHSRYSDDNGETWADYAPELDSSNAPYILLSSVTVTNPRARVCRAWGSDELVWIREGVVSAQPRLYQGYSTTLGTSWETVSDAWVTAPTHCNLVPLRGGGWALIAIENGTSYPTVRRIGAPTEYFEGATPITIDANAATALSACTDKDGVIHAYISSALGYVLHTSSEDGGLTWAPTVVTLRTGTANTYPLWGTCHPARGAILWAHTSNAPVATRDNSLYYEIMGGWGTIEMDQGGDGLHWTSTELPGTLTWLTLTTGGTSAYALGSSGLAVTGYGDAYWTGTTTATDQDAAMMWSVRHSGGSTPSTSYDDLYMSFASGDGINHYHGKVRCSNTAIALYDGGTATWIGSASWDMTLWTQILLTYRVSDRRVQAYARREGSTAWTLIASGTVGATAAATPGYAVWGRSSYSNEYQTKFMSLKRRAGATGGLSVIARQGNDLRGREVSPIPFPLPRWSDTYSPANISALNGPARIGDTWDIPLSADYPLEAIFPDRSPATSRGWRGGAGSDLISNRIVFDVGPQQQALPRYLMVSVLNTNCRYLTLEYWNGAAWSNSGLPGSGFISLSQGFTNLTYTRTGNTIRPNGGNSAARYIQRGEFDGCWVDLGSGYYRKVKHTKQGAWPGSGTVQRAELILDGVTGAEPASGSSLAIHAKDVVWFAHDINIHTTRLRIGTDGSGNADGYAKIGKILVQEAVVTGHAWGWNAARSRAMTRETQSLPDGTTFVRPRGRSLRTWTVDWTDGADQTSIRQAPQTLDWLSPIVSPTEPAANYADLSMVEALLDETRQGQIPVTIASVVPSTSGDTISDPSLFIYGRPASGISITHLMGDEGTDEAQRVGQFVVEELP